MFAGRYRWQDRRWEEFSFAGPFQDCQRSIRNNYHRWQEHRRLWVGRPAWSTGTRAPRQRPVPRHIKGELVGTIHGCSTRTSLILHTNRDPQNTRTDAEIIDCLKRAWLLPREGTLDPVVEAKFSLGSTVSDEGEFHQPPTFVRADGFSRIELQRGREAVACPLSSSGEEQSYYSPGRS